jgi:hypothetical protein
LLDAARSIRVAFPTFQESSSLGLLLKLKDNARTRHGSFLAFPKLSNGDLAQMADYYRKHEASAPGWDKLARIALGFFSEGDKFAAGTRFSSAHVLAAVPASSLGRVWSLAEGMSTGIDLRERGSQSFAPRAPDAVLFDQLAAGAFRILQAERAARRGGAIRLPPIPKEIPKIPEEFIPPVPRLPSTSGLGTLLIVIVIALVLSKGKR